jgi:hypothetical protein
MLPHKVVVLQVWIKPAYAINFFHLPRGERSFYRTACIVPDARKAKAVLACFDGEISRWLPLQSCGPPGTLPFIWTSIPQHC